MQQDSTRDTPTDALLAAVTAMRIHLDVAQTYVRNLPEDVFTRLTSHSAASHPHRRRGIIYHGATRHTPGNPSDRWKQLDHLTVGTVLAHLPNKEAVLATRESLCAAIRNGLRADLLDQKRWLRSLQSLSDADGFPRMRWCDFRQAYEALLLQSTSLMHRNDVRDEYPQQPNALDRVFHLPE